MRISDWSSDVCSSDLGYDLGQGAGFYVNATREPWAKHYRMYDYIVDELPAWVEADPSASDARAISGHSMGGHGALVVALRNPGRYRSVSAFSPIVAPSQVPWGEKAFGAYLGDDREAWKQYDAVVLLGARDQRGFDGCPRRAGGRGAQPGARPQRVCVVADRLAVAGAVG